MNKDDENRLKRIRQIGILTTIPIVMFVSPTMGFFIGDYIDKRFKTSPWFMIFFLIIGLVGGVRETMILLKKGFE